MLEQWMRAKGLGDCARQLLLELDELCSMDVMLPTRPAGEIRLRVVARPEKSAGATTGASGTGPAANPQNPGKCSAENRHLKMRNSLQINSTALSRAPELTNLG
jgi:hypothetical protein